MAKHENGVTLCDSCEEKLQTAHSYLKSWFRGLRQKFLDVHVCVAFRNKEDQNEAFAEGKSMLKFPFSPHNHMENNQPCSLALDIFQLDAKGKALFDPIFYAKVNDYNLGNRFLISWGGQFIDKKGKPFHDFDHFQYNPSKSFDNQPDDDGPMVA